MMKKNILLILMSLTLCTVSFAQDGFHAGIQYGYYLVGMKNGPNTNLSTDVGKGNPLTGFSPKYSSSFGIALGYGFIPMLGVQLELNWMTEGQKAKGTWDGGAAVNRDIDMNYTQIPILLKFRTPGAVAHYYLMAGPQFNFLNSASISDSRGSAYSVSDAKSRFNSSETGLTLGTGLEIDVPKVYFNLGLRLFYGLGDPNTTSFKLPNVGTAYQASQSFYGGLNIGAHYKF
jgi:opacity protein-like surface antigen